MSSGTHYLDSSRKLQFCGLNDRTLSKRNCQPGVLHGFAGARGDDASFILLCFTLKTSRQMGRDLGSEFPPLERRQANTLIKYHNGHIILPVKQPSAKQSRKCCLCIV